MNSGPRTRASGLRAPDRSGRASASRQKRPMRTARRARLSSARSPAAGRPGGLGARAPMEREQQQPPSGRPATGRQENTSVTRPQCEPAPGPERCRSACRSGHPLRLPGVHLGKPGHAPASRGNRHARFRLRSAATQPPDAGARIETPGTPSDAGRCSCSRSVVCVAFACDIGGGDDDDGPVGVLEHGVGHASQDE